MKINALREAFSANLIEEWKQAEKQKFFGLCVSLVHHRFARQAKNPQELEPFTRSEHALADWSIITARLTTDIDLDSKVTSVTGYSKATFEQEVNLAMYLGIPRILIQLRSSRCANLAENLLHYARKPCSPQFLVEVLINNNDWTGEDDDDSITDSAWDSWNSLRSLCNFNLRIAVALEIGPNIQHMTDEKLARWRGENVYCLIFATSTFLTNSLGYPVLSKKHQKFVRLLAPLKPLFILKGPCHHQSLTHYLQYLENLVLTSTELHHYTLGNPQTERYFWDYEEELQIPLQPLKHNLDKATYEVFLRDPIKYEKYTEAIYLALIDRVPDANKDSISVIMVVGAGSQGPLVECAIAASKRSQRAVRVYAVEKNANAVISLKFKKKDVWGDQVIVISSDMRNFNPTEKADIIVSELLGSFGDNELSPECLDGAQRFLKDDGISIPEVYNSWVVPAQACKSWAKLNDIPNKKSEDFEKGYVVLQISNYHPAEPERLFTFRHPNRDYPIDNNRNKTVSFIAKENCVLHGINGYFDTVLYKDVMLSIVPETHSHGMFSWFPMFYPFQYPVHVKKGDRIEIVFWRRVTKNRVWYEYTMTQPVSLPFHNLDGKSYSIGLNFH